jgi:hypothetical protein
VTRPRNVTSIAFLLLLAPLARAQQLPELLQAVDQRKAQQLIEYNSPWFQAELYSAKRFRIVEVDNSVLMRDEDFTVSLFDDLAALHLTKDTIQRREETFAWNALILVDLPDVLRRFGARQTVLFSGLAWDTDESGRASESSNNRFQSPPQTAREIARHRESRKLNKRAFYSVTADFELFPGNRYRVVPLKYTPKYHVLFEVDPEKIVPILVDRVPGEVVERTPADQVKLSDYETFIRSLPPERDVPIVVELP